MSRPEQYFQLGMGYYVAGRFAAHARFNIITGNLCHHAIEMFLKGKLVPKLGWVALSRSPYSHNLVNIWEAFKSEVGDQRLSRFDDTIRRLHAFESLRYPDIGEGKGMDLGAMITVTIGGPPGTEPATGPGANVPNYDLVLGEIDDLARTIFDVCSINPDFFTSSMKYNPHALEYLERNNASFGVSAKGIEVPVSDISIVPEGTDVT